MLHNRPGPYTAAGCGDEGNDALVFEDGQLVLYNDRDQKYCLYSDCGDPNTGLLDSRPFSCLELEWFLQICLK